MEDVVIDGGTTLPNAGKEDLSGFSERPVSIVSEEKKAFLSGACGSSSSFLPRKRKWVNDVRDCQVPSHVRICVFSLLRFGELRANVPMH